MGTRIDAKARALVGEAEIDDVIDVRVESRCGICCPSSGR
jgi:hypothetical protein